MNKKIIIALIAIIAVLSVIAFIGNKPSNTIGFAGYGVIAEHATTSTIVVGTASVATLFTDNEVCASRVISTAGQAIKLSFDSSITPTGITGIVQAASTTEVYDSGLYGCGQVTAYGYSASTTITKSEFR